MTRTAISPLFAISTLENTTYLLLMQFERAKAALAGTRFADFRTVEETGSTNADMVEILRTQDPTEDRRPAVLVADHQSAGRGRRDRAGDARRRRRAYRLLGLRASACGSGKSHIWGREDRGSVKGDPWDVAIDQEKRMEYAGGLEEKSIT